MSHIPLVRLWLGRSDACPLNLSLTRAIEDDEIQDAPVQQILALFISSSRRWKSIRLSLDGIPGPQLLKLLDLPRGSTPILESADLSLPDWNSTDVDKLWTILYRSPTLRRITWGPEYHFSSSNPPAHVPWTRLTHMNLGNLFGFKLTIDEFINTLRPCQELLELIVSIDWPETGNLCAKPMILPKLRTCEVDAWRYNSAIFLNRVVCPRLVSLHLMHGMGRQDIGQPKSCSYIEEFLLRSACDLKTFSISDTTTAITEEDLGNLFKSPSMQSLQDMSLRMKVLTDQTVKLLILPPGRSKPCVLPKLSALSMTSDSQCQTVDGLIFEMVTSRLPILRTIQVMNIFGRPASHDLMHLRALKSKQHPAYEMLRVLPEP